MTLTLIFITLLSLVLSWGIAVADKYLSPIFETIQYEKPSTSRPARKIFKLEDVERLKVYAKLFGVDNTASDVDTDKLLEMGEKLDIIFGHQEVNEMAERVSLPTPAVKIRKRSIGHFLNKVIRITSLIVRATDYIRQNPVGGDDKDEPNRIYA